MIFPQINWFCLICGERVGANSRFPSEGDLRDHLEQHNPNARGMERADVLKQFTSEQFNGEDEK